MGGRNQAEKNAPGQLSLNNSRGREPVAADKIFFLLHSTSSIWHKISERRQTLLCHTLLFLFFFARFLSDDLFGTVLSPAKKVTKKMFLFVLLQTERKPLTVRIFPQRQEELDKTFSLRICSVTLLQQPRLPTSRATDISYIQWKQGGMEGKRLDQPQTLPPSLWSPLATEIPSA